MIKLNKMQVDIAKRIISIGKELKKDDGQIKRALMVAYMRGETRVADYERCWPDGDAGNNLGSKAK